MNTLVVSLTRALSKLSYCSRSQAAKLIDAGRVTVDGTIVTDPTRRVNLHRDTIAVDGVPLKPPREHIYILLNKPRGYVVSRCGDRNSQTVFDLIKHEQTPHLVPVGRLDKASEGMLLLTTDTLWADRLTGPDAHVPKVYHVQIHGKLSAVAFDQLRAGITNGGELLKAAAVSVLRDGLRNQWLSITLTEGRNRHVRRMLATLGFDVLRLVRVQIGSLTLGDLPKGAWRLLSSDEQQLASRTDMA
ncbi:MAG: rRNA pseudouridine synthase [Chlorobi bacterium]|nr:rRNA pseudouridine synthase [Chlorobiota bacterium]